MIEQLEKKNQNVVLESLLLEKGFDINFVPEEVYWLPIRLFDDY